MKIESMIDRPILNNKDAAEDLLVRMLILKGDVVPRRMREAKDLFQSAGIIHRMIENDAVIGKTNNEVYDAYFYIAKGLGVPIISKDHLMKALKTYYGFEIVSVRQGKHVVRMVMTKNSEYSVSHSRVNDFLEKFRRSELLGRTTSDVFLEYKAWCSENDIPSVTNDAFSKLVKAAHGVNVRSKRKGKRVVRVFCD